MYHKVGLIENDLPTYEEISEAKAIILALTELKQKIKELEG